MTALLSEPAPGGGAGAWPALLLRRLQSPAVCSVLAVFTFLFWTAVAHVILPWLSYSVPGMLNLMALVTETGAGLFCFFSCMLTDPGSVPPGWRPDEEQLGAVQEVKKKDGAPRFCKKCSEFKPPRSHHCRVCERCVLRMDHHCQWLNNCVGHANYPNFVRMLAFCSAALVHATVLLLAHAVHFVQSSRTTGIVRLGPTGTAHRLDEGEASPPVVAHIGLQVFALAVAVPTTFAVVNLFIWHIRMVAGNKTTIEHAEGVTAQVKAAACGQGHWALRHPYDLGCLANAHQVLGDNAATWCLPSLRPVPGGLSFPTAFDDHAGDLGF